jgi:periplasmic copper chaperone A
MDGNVMKMREAGQVEIKPSTRLEMKPGDGYHLMLMGLRQPLKAGETFPLTLTFEKAGKAEVKVTVQEKAEGKPGSHHMH